MYDSNIFLFSPDASRQMRKRISPLNNIRLSLVRTKVIYQISTKIPRKRMQKRSKMERRKEKKKKKKRLYTSPPLSRRFEREEIASEKRSGPREGNRNNSMTEGNETRSSPSFNEFHALLCPYSFAEARAHAYPPRSSS